MGDPPTPLTPSFRNEILRVLPPDEVSRLRPHLTRVRLVNGQVLQGSSERIEQVLFVEQGFVSIVAEADAEGTLVECGLIGRESMVGLPVLFGHEVWSFARAMVQMPGIAYSMLATSLAESLDRMPVMHRALMHSMQLLDAQVAQTAACNGRHNLTERLARWLLMAHDRCDNDELQLTQEFLAIMLAVRRSGVTMAIQSLEASGLIRHSRGRITVIDRSGLERAACICYQRVRQFAAKLDTEERQVS